MKKLIVSFSLIMNLMSTSSHAIIPFNQALDVFENTKQERQSISPFWGMVALHGKLMERIRFFGPYSHLVEDIPTRKIQEAYIHPSLRQNLTTRNPPVLIEYPLDPIASLIQHLFPCPDGVQFVANTRNKDPVGNLSRHLDKMDDLIQILINPSNVEEKRDKIFSILKSLDKHTKTKVNRSFANLLIDAYQEQTRLANPLQSDQQMYPENIVIISLLSFFCQIGNSQDDFKHLPFLMNGDEKEQRVFSKEEYFRFKGKGKETLDQIVTDLHHPELTFLMGKGYELYDSFISDPISYRGDVSYKTLPTFPDCGETSLRNVLMLLLSNQGMISTTSLDNLKKKIIPIQNIDIEDPAIPFQKMISFFTDHTSLADASTKETHDDWAQVVSDLNDTELDHKLEDVQYGRGLKGNKNTYEIKASQPSLGVFGLISMLNVIAKIIPDQILNLPWSHYEQKQYQQAEQKLSRLCEILSQDGREISWENKDTKDKQITGPYLTLTLLINREKAYDWQFKNGHFQLNRLRTPSNDWRLAYRDLQTISNHWLGAIYRHLSYFTQDNPQRYPANEFLDLIYNNSLKQIDGTLETIAMILDQNLSSFYPLINRWIQKSIPLNDQEAFSKLALLLYGFQDHPAVAQIQIPHIQGEIDKISRNVQESLFKASKEGYLQTVKKLLTEGAQANVHDDQKMYPIHWAAQHGYAAIVKFLIDHDSCVEEQNMYNETPLHLAALEGHDSVIKVLLENGAKINCQNSNKETPLHKAVYEGHASTIKYLVSKGASTKLRDLCGFTPLQWAHRFKHQFALSLLQ